MTLQEYWDDALVPDPRYANMLVDHGFTDRILRPVLRGYACLHLTPEGIFQARRLVRMYADGRFRVAFDVADGQIIQKFFPGDAPVFLQTLGRGESWNRKTYPDTVPVDLARALGVPAKKPGATHIDRDLTHLLP